MIQFFALMAASLAWNLTVASPVQLSQHMVPAYAPASSSNGIASFRPNYRFHPQFARQRAAAPTRQSGRLYPSYPERRADFWPFTVSYQPIVTPWQNSHYSQALAGGYQPYQLVIPMPWMANRGPWMGQRPVPAYPAVPMGYGPLAGLPWGDAPPIALSYPIYYHALAPREAQHPFQRLDRRYIRGQFVAANPRFRQVPSPQRHVAASYNGPRRMGYRFRPVAPVYPAPLNYAPVAVIQWQPRTPHANPVVQWQKREPYGTPAYQFRSDPRLAQAPKRLLPGASKDGRQSAFPGYGQSFR
ncbi:hypothetical protein [Candidatus Vondammii sp. HM_W22]|uniref:hypothetical protein n=1 Tax=Candidatus Vondammii sp. HM_W22 TaxID=2687299 RepID=UPI001F129F3B|nr:hypothetical protein [Candidatus Vondammii sp. HM_W22]